MPIADTSQTALWDLLSKMADELQPVAENPHLFTLAAYAATLMQRSGSIALETYTNAVVQHCPDEALRDYLLEDEDFAMRVLSPVLAQRFETDELSEFVIEGGFVFDEQRDAESPYSVSAGKLATTLLDIQPGDNVADFQCGIGDFLMEAAEMRSAQVYGTDIDKSSVMLAKARFLLIGMNAYLEAGGTPESLSGNSFDKAFAVLLPWTMPDAHNLNVLPRVRRSSTWQWDVAWKISELLVEGGRAFVIMTFDAAMDIFSRQIRLRLVENGKVEAIIALPPSMLQGTAVKTIAVILGSSNLGTVRMMDASKLADHLGSTGISRESKIERLLHDGSASSICVSAKAIKEQDCSLNPTLYVKPAFDIAEESTVGSIVTEVIPGRTFSKKAFEKWSDEDGRFTFLRATNIQNNAIVGDLAQVFGNQKALERCLVKPHDLLIAITFQANAENAFRVTVADPPEGSRFIAGTGLCILRLNQEKVDPYYAAAFFTGKTGQNLLAKTISGGAIARVSIKDLKALDIPLPAMDEQREVGERYQRLVHSIAVGEKELARNREELNNLCNVHCASSAPNAKMGQVPAN